MKKAILTVISLVLVVAMSVAGTLAFLKVDTDPVVNTFSPSNIDLTLVETPVNGGSEKANSYKMIPGVELSKDPKVTVTADIDTYVFVEVNKINDVDTFLTWAVDEKTDANPNGVWTKLQEGVYYRAVSAAVAADGESFYVLAGNKVTVKDSVLEDHMATLYDENGNVKTTVLPQLTFTAYAVQQQGLDVAQAWVQAQSLKG